MPDNFGLFLCGVLVREHNNPICVRLMGDWWDELVHGCVRDQISFPYVLWKNGYTKEDIMLVCEDEEADPWKECPYWDYVHKHNKARTDVREK